MRRPVPITVGAVIGVLAIVGVIVAIINSSPTPLQKWLTTYQNPASVVISRDFVSFDAQMASKTPSLVTIAKSCTTGDSDLHKIDQNPLPPVKWLKAPYKALLTSATAVFDDCLGAIDDVHSVAVRENDLVKMQQEREAAAKDEKRVNSLAKAHGISVTSS